MHCGSLLDLSQVLHYKHNNDKIKKIKYLYGIFIQLEHTQIYFGSYLTDSLMYHEKDILNNLWEFKSKEKVQNSVKKNKIKNLLAILAYNDRGNLEWYISQKKAKAYGCVYSIGIWEYKQKN